jgi:hypothetical protein
MKGRLLSLGLAAALAANAYTWDFTSSTPWDGSGSFASNGSKQVTSGGVTFSGGGSMIWTPAVSGTNPNDYDVQSSLSVAHGNTFIHFLRASSTSVQSGSGSYVSAELVTSGPGLATLNIKQCVSGTVSLLAGAQATVTSSTTFRTVIFGTNLWVYINGTLAMQQTLPSATTGQPGIGGVVGATAPDAFQSVQIGPHWTSPPPAISSTSFLSSAYPNTASMKWPAVSPGKGPGILQYVVLKNGAVVDYTSLPEYLDATVQPSTTYTYAFYTVDIHGNGSAETNFSITTPPAGTGPGAPPNSFDPRRTGVQTTGAYWGGAGEQIDTRSGNLNFSFPILTALGRTGWTVPVNLVYNSQNWRLDNGVNWQYGYDVGFGFGWKMLIGSITPYYASAGGPLDHFVFTDNTGAEYRLDQNNGVIWWSLQGIYVWFDANTDKLHFKDGTFWTMGSVSGGTEQDAGTMYPTIIEDVNGNQVIVTYKVGAGTTAANTSARINTIADVRAYNSYTYSFSYDQGTPVSHLVSLANTIGTGEASTFSYVTGAELSPPFGADAAWSGKTTAQLVSRQVGSSPGTVLGTYQFTYDPAGAQELTQVTFPWGGYLKWDYASFAYAGGRSLREVSARYLAADSAGANKWTYPITRPDAPNSVQVHSGMTLTDASGNGAKAWSFWTTTTATNAWQAGLVSDFRQLATAGSANAITHDSYAWSQDTAGNPYISARTSVADEGTPNAQTALSAQTLDQYGNVTQSILYPFNNTTTPLKTYNNTYLNDSGTNPITGGPNTYIENYIRNRLVTTTLTTGGATKTLVQNAYDVQATCCNGFAAGSITQIPNFAASEIDLSPPLPVQSGWYTGRGWLVTSTTPAKTTGFKYYVYGGVASTNGTDGSTTTASVGAATNYAAPQSISTQSYSETIGYTSWLGVAQTTGLNGEQLNLSYDSVGRPSAAISPYGGTTFYTYTSPGSIPMQQMKTGADGFTRTTLDGLGRPIRVERGTDVNTIQSIVDTVYAPCACSPLGKIQKVSQPYAPGTSSLRPPGVPWGEGPGGATGHLTRGWDVGRQPRFSAPEYTRLSPHAPQDTGFAGETAYGATQRSNTHVS